MREIYLHNGNRTPVCPNTKIEKPPIRNQLVPNNSHRQNSVVGLSDRISEMNPENYHKHLSTAGTNYVQSISQKRSKKWMF